MKKKKLLSADLDGTLMFRNEGRPYFKEPDKAALAAFRQAGNLVVINSGRALAWLVPPLEGNLTWDYLIAASGACILGQDGTLLYGQTLPFALVQKILREHPTQVEVTFITRDRIYALRQKKPHSLPVEPIQAVEELAGETLYGFSVHFATPQEAEAFRESLERTDGDALEVFVNTKDVDVVKKGCSKGVALRWLQHHLGLDADSIYAVGDAANDIDMLKAAAHPFTFHPSEDRVKACCEGCVDSVAELLAQISE